MAGYDWVVWLKTPGYPVLMSPNVLRLSCSVEGIWKLLDSLVPSEYRGALAKREVRPGSSFTSMSGFCGGEIGYQISVGDTSDGDVEPVKETGLFYAGQEDV